MNPDETLKAARAAMLRWADMQDGDPDALEALEAAASAFDALDEWLTGGGALPGEWDPKCGAPCPGERVRCLLRPKHAGAHRHDVPGSSRSWT